MKAYSIAQQIATSAEVRGWRAYIVGGFVRDKVLGIESKDIDIEMFGPAGYAELAAFAAQFGTVNEIGQSFNVIKIHVPDEEPIDLSLPRRDIKINSGHKGFLAIHDGTLSLRAASERRDYTFNALFLDPLTDRIFDFHNGISDLHARRLRHVGHQFAEDPMRVLRGMQFCGRFDLTADSGTVALCRSLYSEYETLSPDRIYDEWEKWCLKSVRPSRGLVFLHRTGWIRHYPALSALLRLPQDERHHPEKSAWRHTLQCVDRVALLSHPDDRLYLMFAALLHDVGKPQTTIIYPDGRITTHGHDKIGAEIAIDFLDSIRVSVRTADIVSNLVREHMTFTAHSDPTPRTVRRLAVRLSPATIRQFVTLVRCDLTSRGSLQRDLSFLDTVTEIAANERCAESAPEPLVKGRHLIALGLRPGPHFTPILSVALNAQLDGTFSDIESGIAFIQSYLAQGE